MKSFKIKSMLTGRLIIDLECESLKACVEKAVWAGVDLIGADLVEAELRGAILIGANLREADLRGADLRWTDLTKVDLTGADLTEADLSGADLTGADLTDTDLRGANLKGADLTKTNLKNTYLTETDIGKEERLQWKVHTPNLLKEILNNEHTFILLRPLQALGNMLHDVATRASQLNDPELNKLMIMLTLYSAADPESEDYDPELVKSVMEENE